MRGRSLIGRAAVLGTADGGPNPSAGLFPLFARCSPMTTMLAARDPFEQQAFRRLRNLNAKHRAELEVHLGLPPNLAAVPQEFWDRVEKEEQEELTLALLLIFIMASTMSGMDSTDARMRGEIWASRRAQWTSRKMAGTTRDRLRGLQTKWDSEGSVGVTRVRGDLNRVLGQDRAMTVAVTETTKAITAGVLTAAGQGFGADARWRGGELNAQKVIWELGPCEHCTACPKLAGTDISFWGRFTDGPPLHANCVLPGNMVQAVDYLVGATESRFDGLAV